MEKSTRTCLHVSGLFDVWYRSLPQFIFPVMSELIEIPLNNGSLSPTRAPDGSGNENCKYGQILLTNSEQKWNQLTHYASLVPSKEASQETLAYFFSSRRPL